MLGKKIKELRIKLGLSQEKLAQRLKLKYYNIGDWERGKCEPPIEFLIKLAQIFNVTIDYLVGNSNKLCNIEPNKNLTINGVKMLKIRDLREEKGLTQKELAERLGVSPSNIYNYETGRTEPSIDLLCQLSRLLGVTVDYLIGNTDELGNVVPGEDLSEEEKKLVICYRGIGKPERLALMTTAQSFYNQAKDSKNKVII